MIIKFILIAIIIASMLSVCIDGYSLYSLQKNNPKIYENYKIFYGISMSLRLIVVFVTFYLIYTTN